MRSLRSPCEAYRRVELDARIEGSPGTDLTRICLERAIGELDQAKFSQGRGDEALKRDGLNRAAASITALAQGVGPDNPLRDPLLTLYDAAVAAIYMMQKQWQPDTLGRVRDDLIDILGIVQAE